MSERLAPEDTAEHIVDTNDGTNLGKILWTTFSSMRTAVTLLLLLAAVSVIGTIIPQGASPEDYARFGPGGYATLKALGFTDLYRSSWYQLIILLIGANLAVCSINRFSRTWKQAYRPEVAIGHARVGKMQGSQTIQTDSGTDETAEKVKGALRAAHYSVREERTGDEISIYAARGTANLWGRYLAHVSVLVIFLGGMVGSMLGLEGYTTIVEGRSTNSYFPSRSEKPADLKFRVALKKFYIEHDDEHNPTAYKSDLQVYDADKLVAGKVVDVDHPLTYRGVSFYQSDYGIVGFYLVVTGANGESVRVPISVDTKNGPEGKLYMVSEQEPRQIKIGKQKLSIFVHDFAPDYVGGEEISASFMPIHPAAEVMVNDRFPEYKGQDAWSNLGWIPISGSAKYKGFRITMESAVSYTGLQVASNPGLPAVCAGFAILLLGVFCSFYVARTVVRASIMPSSGGTLLRVATSSRSGSAVIEREAARLREAVG